MTEKEIRQALIRAHQAKSAMRELVDGTREDKKLVRYIVLDALDLLVTEVNKIVRPKLKWEEELTEHLRAFYGPPEADEVVDLPLEEATAATLEVVAKLFGTTVKK